MALLAARKTNYPYAVARVQAKRGKLIPRSEYDKILKMDVSEITRFIEESEYKAEVDELSSRFGGLDLLEAALTVNEERTYAEIRRMLSGDGGRMAAAFLDRYFVEDIKTVLRGKNAKASREELLKELLLEDLDTYNVFLPLLAEDVKTIPDVIDALERQSGVGAAWAKVLRKVPDDASLPAYEDALDKAYFARLLASTEDFHEKGGDALRDFVRREIDARNLQNAGRWAAAKQSGDFSRYVIPGGKSLNVATIIALAESGSLEAFDEALQGHDVYESVGVGLTKARESRRMIHFMVAVEGHLYEGLDRLAHRHPLSIVPVLSYILRKREEVITLRAVARGKAAGLSDERLKELIQ